MLSATMKVNSSGLVGGGPSILGCRPIEHGIPVIDGKGCTFQLIRHRCVLEGEFDVLVAGAVIAQLMGIDCYGGLDGIDLGIAVFPIERPLFLQEIRVVAESLRQCDGDGGGLGFRVARTTTQEEQ